MCNPASLIYKCRRCGDKKASIHVPDGSIALVNIVHGTELPKEWGCVVPRMTQVHACKDDGLGVADLIGCEFDEKG